MNFYYFLHYTVSWTNCHLYWRNI